MPAATMSVVDKILADAFSSAGFEESDIFESRGFIPTGNLAFDYVLGGDGLPRGRTAEFYGLSQSGKAQPLDASVLTPSGYRRMGDLRVGDAVIDPEGQTSEVTGVFPQGVQDIYRITFSDGSSCECTEDHLWPFRYRVSRRAEFDGRNSKQRGVNRKRQIFEISDVVPLKSMMTPSRIGSSAWRPSLDSELRSDIDFVESDITVDPYLLGLLLGDGTLCGDTALFTSEDQELADAVDSALPVGVFLRENSRFGNGVTYRLATDLSGGKPNPLTVYLRLLGLMGSKGSSGYKSNTKFVPMHYMVASAKTRLAVLQGLLDTDAEACPGGGAAIFGSSSQQLRDDVVWIARSLGCRVTVGQREVKGTRVSGGSYYTSYSARVTSREVPLFRLSRKSVLWERRSITGDRPGWVDGLRPRVLVSVELSRRAEAQCISVSASSHLYVTDDFIPTHNTSAACSVGVEAQKMGLLVCYFDYEQALDERYLNKMGLKTRDKALFRAFPAGSLEAGCDVAVDLARTGDVGLMVFDSVPAMVPRSSAEDDKDSRTLAMERARLLGNFMSKMNPILARTGSTVIFINHIRDVIQTGPTRPGMPKLTTTPGGSALKFYSSVRVKFGVMKKFTAEQVDPLTGETIKVPHSILSAVEVTKNKVAAPFKSAQLYLELGSGFSQGYSAIQVLIGNRVVKKNGSFFVFPEELYNPSMSQGPKGYTIQGLQKILDLSTDPEWCEKLVRVAIASLPREDVILSTPDIETDGEVPVQNSDDDVLGAEEELPTEPLVKQTTGTRTSFASSRQGLDPTGAVDFTTG